LINAKLASFKSFYI